LVLAVGLVYVMYVNPQIEDVSAGDPADAVVALAGAPRSVGTAQELVERGAAKVLVVSNAYGPDDAQMRQLCGSDPVGYEVICFVPSPDTTRGEARAVGRLALERGWHDVVVVTLTYHVSRARLIVGRCYQGRLRMQQSPEADGPASWAYQLAYQTAAFVKAAVLRGC
jgi:hypothetical protein